MSPEMRKRLMWEEHEARWRPVRRSLQGKVICEVKAKAGTGTADALPVPVFAKSTKE